MTKKSWLIITAICFVIGLLYYTCFKSDLLGHHAKFEIDTRYLRLFKDSVRNDLDSANAYSWVKSNDILADIHYQDSFDIVIWEFKNLPSIQLDSIKINDKTYSGYDPIESGETIDPTSYQATSIKYGYSLNNGINVSLDLSSSIQNLINGNSYKGFYGNVREVSLKNNKGESQIIFNYMLRKESILFLFYKYHESFFIIIFNSKNPFNTKLFNILNLE